MSTSSLIRRLNSKSWSAMSTRDRTIGLVANAVLVGVSVVCFWPELIYHFSFWVVVGIASLLCDADLAREGETTTSDRLPAWNRIRILCHLTGLVVFCIWWSAIIFAGSDAVFRLLTGIAIAFAGASIRKKAVVTLGEEFVSDVRPSRGRQMLKTDGVYSLVRHPSELGLLLVCLGAGFATGSVLSLGVSLVVLIPISCVRVRYEERSLRDEFGDFYVDYEKRTGCFLPSWSRAIGSN